MVGGPENPFGGGPIGDGPIGPGFEDVQDEIAFLDSASIAVAGQAISVALAFAVAPAQLAYAGQEVEVSTPAMPVDVHEIAVAGQGISFQHTFAVAPAQLAYEGQDLAFVGLLDLDVTTWAYEGQIVVLQVSAALAPAQIAFAGQGLTWRASLNLSEALFIAVEGQSLGIRATVKPVHDRYPYCGRTGFRVPLGDLVEDGRRPGLYVQKGWDDDVHPQEWPQQVGPDGGRVDRSAPPQDPVEEYEQVVLTIDGEEVEV